VLLITRVDPELDDRYRCDQNRADKGDQQTRRSADDQDGGGTEYGYGKPTPDELFDGPQAGRPTCDKRAIVAV